MVLPQPAFSCSPCGWHWDGVATRGGRCSSRRSLPLRSGRRLARASASMPIPWAWLASNALDALRYAIWFAFLASLLTGRSGGETGVERRWRAAALGNCTRRDGTRRQRGAFGRVSFCASDRRASAHLEFGLRLGLAVFGLILVEQLLRRAPPDARWSIRHLCVGLAGVFAFDLLLYADAMLYARLDPDIWVARGVANLLVIPFVAISTARNTGWTIEMHMSRSVVFHSTALLLSGVVPARDRRGRLLHSVLRRRMGQGAADRADVRRVVLGVLVLSSGPVPVELRSSSASISSRTATTTAPKWLRFTAHARQQSSAPSLQQRAIKALATSSKARVARSGLQTRTRAFRAAARAEHGSESKRASPAKVRSCSSSSAPGGSYNPANMRRSPRVYHGSGRCRSG